MHPEPVEYCLRTCAPGRLLVAATERGVCFVAFLEGEADPRDRLAGELPAAEHAPARGRAVHAWADRIARAANGRRAPEVPLDVGGSPFQRRVWNALRRIPRGRTRSYSEIARQLGTPSGARAVARACAANPTPIATPCHRVIESSGAPGGYAHGPERKRRLLELEGALASPTSATRPSRGSLPSGPLA